MPRAKRHSSATVGSCSFFARALLARARSSLGSNCASAQTAAPRTSGCASSRRAAAVAANDGSPELPIATRTLRRNRARPSRLTGLAANSARKPASSSRTSSASGGDFEIAARCELRLAAGVGELVPRADREAVVAAVDAVADPAAQFARDRAFVLDGEVGDAAPGVEPVGRRKGAGRADVEAGPAGSAMVGFRLVGRELEIGQDRAEEQPRAEFARHQIGVLALPTDASPLRRAAFPSRARCRRTP